MLYTSKARRDTPNWHCAHEYGHSKPQRWCLMCIMCSLTVKNKKDVETLVRSKTQKTDDTNTAPQTRAGTALPTWAEHKPLPSLYMPKGARSCTVLSPMLTSQALPVMPNHGPLPPDPPQSLNLAFRGSRV